ncbi:MAG: diacylglycerol kinase family lipid kinase [Spirochaetales bacterium]|nr:diacylglycerol kinase family lipid kinase [Spirochaetales bacterium]
MKISMIVNPNAGKKKGLAAAERASIVLREAGFEVETFISQKPGETLALARDLDIRGTDGILAVGGDGTLFEVINGLLTERKDIPVPLGQIPVGTGNSFIKDLGILSVEDAVAKVVGGNTRQVDLGRFTAGGESWYFINLLGAGFVSEVAYRAKQFKMFGPLAYVGGVFSALTALKAVPSRITIDGKVHSRDLLFIELCNSRYTGGDMLMAPGAAIDDGLFDIIVMSKATRRRVLQLLPLIFTGKHVQDTTIEVFQGVQVDVDTDLPLPLTPDGETFGSTPVSARMLPGRLRMFC